MHFALLAKLAARLGIAGAEHGHERRFRAAPSQFGATYVRIGTAIFGARVRSAIDDYLTMIVEPCRNSRKQH